MQVRILGPFEIMRDDVLVTPSAPKPRQILALLAVCNNSVVRADQIIEELWEDRPPLSATTTLQTYIYQLRKVLHSGCGPAENSAMLRTCPGGYLLSLPSDALDSYRFERLAEQGRAEMEAGKVEVAASTLRRALQLWRGRAFSDTWVGPILQAETVRLEEARKTALVQRIDAEMALGRHQELIGELSGVVAEQPTHEGFWAKLMLALYRSGRRADALHGFQQVRNTLADELGLEPSQELQQLHREILAADPALAVPALRSGPGAGHVTSVQIRRPELPDRPDQLPPPGAHLIGREAEQEILIRVLSSQRRDAPAVAVVLGAPGSGKTALATRVACRLRDAHSDGALYANLGQEGGPVSTGDVLGQFLQALGATLDRIPDSLDGRARAFRGMTADRRLLIVLDDVTHRKQLLGLLPSGAGCSVLVVARRRIAHASVGVTVNVPPLSTAQGMDLLTTTLNRKLSGIDELAGREIVTMCAGLPLVLRSVATRMQVRPHWGTRFLAGRLRTEPRLLVNGPDGEPTLTRSVSRSRGALRPAADQAFERLVEVPTPVFSLDEAARVLGLDEAAAEALLEEAVEFQLVVVETTGLANGHFRYAVPPLIQLAAAPAWLPDVEVPTPRLCLDFV